MRTIHRLYFVFIAALFVFGNGRLWADTSQQEMKGKPLAGTPVLEVLQSYSKLGFQFIYSSNYVTPDLLVKEEPRGNEPFEIIQSILEPHGLELRQAGDKYLIVKTEHDVVVDIEPDKTEIVTIELEPGPLAQEEVSVTASRYVLYSPSQTFIDQQAIQALPKLGDDPIRVVQRLQGAAANGFSSRSYIRGGQYNETSIYLNGQRLLEPFHIRDYHSLFSFIDARAISGLEVFTGGFPSEYGNDMSGLLLLDSKQPEKQLHTELGVSFFNTSLLNSGFNESGSVDWLFSARRSNLDMILNEDLGEPNYFDIFANVGFNLSPDMRISINGLYADDDVIITTETNPGELEQSDSNTINKTFWMRVENSWRTDLSSDTVLSFSELSNRRLAMVNDPLEMISRVEDIREIESLELRHAMHYSGLSNHLLSWGLEFSRQSAYYHYLGGAEYFGFTANNPGIQNPVAYEINTNPSGNSYALFLSDRFSVTNRLSFEVGLRWDKQTYTEPTFTGQLSPRASLLFAVGTSQSFRLTIGRFYQAQAIQELQVEDNIRDFHKPQFVDHFIAGYQWATESNYQFRAEAYYKDYKQVANRFENLFDQLQLVPEFQPDRVRLDPQSARAMGLEFSVEYAGSETLDWWASYTLSRATDSINGTNQRRSWDQLNALQLGLSWQRNAWELGIAGRIHTGWPETGLTLGFDNETSLYYPQPGPRNAERYGLFATLDLRLSKRFNVSKGQLTGFVEVINLTNRNNPCCVDYGSDVDANGNYSFEQKIEYWLPFLPSIGILWEF